MNPLRTAVLVLLPVVLMACATPGPGVRSQDSAIPVPANPTSDVANPAPTLLVRLDVGYLGNSQSRHTADYLSDGTVIRWTDAGTVCEWAQPCGSLERNTLTAAGLAALRTLLAEDSDLLGRPGTFEPRLLPGREWSGRSNIFDIFVSGQPDGSRVTVLAASSTSYDAPNWAPDPAVDRLNDLARVLVDPATLAGASGLAASTWTPYTPEKTAVFIRFTTIEPVPSTPAPPPESGLPLIGKMDGTYPYIDISDAGWPFAGTPDTFGSLFTPEPPAGSRARLGTAFRCAYLPTADAAAGIGRFPVGTGATLAAGDLASGVDWNGATLRWSANGPTTGLALSAAVILPEDAGSSCADLQPD